MEEEDEINREIEDSILKVAQAESLEELAQKVIESNSES